MKTKWLSGTNLGGAVSVILTMEVFLIEGMRDALTRHGAWIWVNLVIWIFLGITISIMVWRGRTRRPKPDEIDEALESARQLVFLMTDDVDRPPVHHAWDRARKALIRIPRRSIKEGNR